MCGCVCAPWGLFPAWFGDSLRVPKQLNAFVSYPTTDLAGPEEQQRRREWNVSPALTQKVAEAGVAWGRFECADVVPARNIHQIRTKNLHVARLLGDGIMRFGMAGVTH
jgi:hypothetical protein